MILSAVSLPYYRYIMPYGLKKFKRLGKVMDIEFDAMDGHVDALVVPGEFKAGSMLRGKNAAS